MSAIRRVLTAVFCMLAVTSCQEDGQSAVESESAFPDLLRIQGEACEKKGGRWGPAPSKASFVCYRTLSDANTGCRVESDCEGMCLARSRTCSPIEPFFGCHQVLSDSGFQQTLCVE